MGFNYISAYALRGSQLNERILSDGQLWRYWPEREHTENRNGGKVTYYAHAHFLVGDPGDATYHSIFTVPAYVLKAFGISYLLRGGEIGEAN